MEHFYQNIDGWFSYENIYSQVVKNARDGSHFVEIGCWLGKSTSYMGVEILNSGKKIAFDCIDTWEGSKEHLDPNSGVYTPNLMVKDWLYNNFLMNITPVKDVVNPIKGNSVEVSKMYANKSLDFVFLDGSHEYEDVVRDITSWLPKVKLGGLIGGDDIAWSGVNRAVKEIFDGQFIIEEGYWFIKIEN